MMRGSGHGLGLVILIMALGCQEVPESHVVARVDESRLTEQDIEARIPVQMIGRITSQDRRRIAEEWVEAELLYQEALRKKLDEDPAIKTRLSRVVRDMLIAELLAQAFKEDSEVSDDEIRVYYEAQQEDFIREKPEIRARHILVKSKGELNRVRKRLKNGELFGDVAQEVSVDASSAEAGGDLGYFTEDIVDPSFWDACQKARLGRQTSSVTRLGHHVIEILDRREAGTVRDQADVWGEIRQRILVERRQAKRLELLVDLRNRIPWAIEVGEEK